MPLDFLALGQQQDNEAVFTFPSRKEKVVHFQGMSLLWIVIENSTQYKLFNQNILPNGNKNGVNYISSDFISFIYYFTLLYFGVCAHVYM